MTPGKACYILAILLATVDIQPGGEDGTQGSTIREHPGLTGRDPMIFSQWEGKESTLNADERVKTSIPCFC